MQKLSENTLYGNFRDDAETIDQYETYNDTDIPMSMEEKSLVRKIDFFLMPIVCITIFLQFLDKSCISYAVALDLKQDLKMNGRQYSLAAGVFYIGYFVYQPLNNYFLQRLPVGKYVGATIFIWGIVLASTAAAKDFAQLAGLRFLLGFFEAGVYPALTLLVSTFYRRDEQAARLGSFWVCNGTALVTGGLITFGIDKMENALNLAKWRWIMIILGALTSFVGVFCFCFLIDNPKSPSLRLNAEQEILVEERTRDNAVVRTTMIKTEHIFEALREPRFWCVCFCCLLLMLQNGALTTFNTQFAIGFGFNGIDAVLLSMGTGAADIMFILFAIHVSGRTKQTLYTAMFLVFVSFIGLVLFEVIPSPHYKLIGYYLSWAYCSAYVLVITCVSNNVSGYTKKIFYNGMMLIFYTIGNFCGPLMVRDDQAPNYAPALITYICANAVVIGLLFIIRQQMSKVNKERLSCSDVVMTNVEDDLSDVQDPNFLYRL